MMEDVFLDQKGQQIQEYDLVRVFHFYGRKRGRSFEKHYMYKWVIKKEGRLFALHLGNEIGDGFFLSCFGKSQLNDFLILQSPKSIAKLLERV